MAIGVKPAPADGAARIDAMGSEDAVHSEADPAGVALNAVTRSDAVRAAAALGTLRRYGSDRLVGTGGSCGC